MSAINAAHQLPSRDPSVAEGLVELNYGRLCRWFLWLTNSPGDAADLTQDTFAVVWESLERLRPRRSGWQMIRQHRPIGTISALHTPLSDE